jgi:uncharacterized protein (TIGR00290 family)
MKNLPKKLPIVSSWSGGKDSCLALHHAIQNGAEPKALLSMLDESGMRSRSHGLPLNLLQQQAAAMGIPLVTHATSWAEYETVFIKALSTLKESGIRGGVFGDIDIEEHRKWEEMVCNQAGIEAYLPLWQKSRFELLNKLFKLDYHAIIVVTRDDKLGKDFIGEQLTPDLVSAFERIGIDPCGENGEYHTVVVAGPLFNHKVELKFNGPIQHSGYWFLDIQADQREAG